MWAADTTGLVTVGYNLPSVVAKMPWTGKFQINHDERTVTIPYLRSEDMETTAIWEQLEAARARDSFLILRKWRPELYTIVGTNRDTFPGMLDNTVGGGMVAGEAPLECLVREAGEEASLAEDWVRQGAKAVGAISYFYVRDARAGGEVGLLQPATQHLYDIELPADVVPKPSDGEVQEFSLRAVDETMVALTEGQFKPNSAVALIDFLIRHGQITAKNQPDYLEFVSRIHRRIHF
ncbi:MAG: hypothetical protein Q9209_004285 [Squamulea sp. 1 TL-2023]